MQSSFIPKKNYEKKSTGTGNYVSLLMFISLAIFLGTVLAAGGGYFYKNFLESELKNKSEILVRENSNLNLGLIQELSRLDTRIKSAETILNKHISLLPLFELLKKNTLKGVSFNNFDFSVDKKDFLLKLDGTAIDYASVALQSNVFGKNKNILEPIFSELGVNADGNVTFSMTAKIDSRLLSYRDSLIVESTQ